MPNWGNVCEVFVTPPRLPSGLLVLSFKAYLGLVCALLGQMPRLTLF